jgi:hypothetical protein
MAPNVKHTDRFLRKKAAFLTPRIFLKHLRGKKLKNVHCTVLWDLSFARGQGRAVCRMELDTPGKVVLK